jgi:CBS domain-containing protein
MFRHKIKYFIVESNGEQIGVISRNKLLSDQAESPLLFIQSVRQANSKDELKTKWMEVPEIVYQLLTRGVKPELVNQVITSISDSILLKVIERTIENQGKPPSEFVFMVLGSEGRKEQTLKTDQDNAIIYEDKANENREEVRHYFLEFASSVSEELNEIGFKFCTGDLMAKNPKWTHSLSHWKENYNLWIENKDAESVMNFSTFFDCRMIYGNKTLIEELQAHVLEKLSNPGEYFYVQLANNALLYDPPLTFFRQIKTVSKGEQKVFNIKHAMNPIVDMVRAFALKNKILKTNTGLRLIELKKASVITDEEYQELTQAYYYLMALRLKHQASQIINKNEEPDNFISPMLLTKVEQVTITEIFKVIENFQDKMKIQFLRKLF